MASKKQELRISEIVSLEMELEGLLGEESLGFSLKYDLSKLLKKIKGYTSSYFEVRKGILDKYGSLAEDGKTYTFDDENQEIVTSELKKIGEKKESFTEKFKKSEFEPLKSKNPYYIIMSFIE